jgi:hypothetical protein
LNRRTERALVVTAVGAAGVVATAVTGWAVTNSPTLVEPASFAVWRSPFVARPAA